VGFGLWFMAGQLGLALPLPWALVFGALISPTDPVAVLATVRLVKLSKTLQVVLQGEALFNDGVGIVAFTALLALAMGTGEMIAVPFYAHQIGLLVAAIPLVLIARFAVVLPWGAYYRFAQSEKRPTLILGWGGLHGALSLALALTIPQAPERSLILSITYAV